MPALNTTSSASSASSTMPPLDHSLDTPGPSILHLEHVNFEHPDQPLATLFYTALLQLTLDPHRTCSASTLWFNVGQQQFHIQSGGGRECKTRGPVGLVLDRQRWEELDGRWRELQLLDAVRKTQMSVELRVADPKAAGVRLVVEHWNVSATPLAEEKEATEGGVPFYRVVGPWGQLYDVYCAAPSSSSEEPSMGLAYVEETLPAAALDDVAQYYRHYFDTQAERLTDADGSTVAAITVGTRQRLLYRSPPKSFPPASLSAPAAASWHYCIYLSTFASIFRRMEQDGLVYGWTTGRSECVSDFEGAKEARQFRGFELKAGEGAPVVWRLEQELRCGKHRHYNRRLVNEWQMGAKERWSDLKLNGILPPVAC